MGLFDKFFRKPTEKDPCKKILEEIVKASYDCANLLKENLAFEKGENGGSTLHFPFKGAQRK